MSTVRSDQRFTHGRPCPVCGGTDQNPRGAGIRCHGFLSNAGDFANCSREELAGPLERHEVSETYSHWLAGPCRCGVDHADPRAAVKIQRRRGRPPKVAEQVVASFKFYDEAKTLLFEEVRYEPKKFRVRRPDPAHPGAWLPDINGTRLVLYHLPDLKDKPRVFVVEGPKDADTLWALGLPATSNAFGAGKWIDDYATQLVAQGVQEVVVLRDEDTAGRRHQEQVAASCAKAGLRVVTLTLPGFGPESGGDVSDWVAAGHTAADLDVLLGAAEEMKPGDDQGVEVSTIEVPVFRPRAVIETPTLDVAAYHGPAGTMVRALEGRTEAHPATLMMHLLVGFGNLVGRGPHMMVSDTPHHVNFYAGFVGPTAEGAKGMGSGPPVRILSKIDPRWEEDCLLSALSTGEGLLNRVADKFNKDGGLIFTDKRVFYREQEFGRLLAVKSREGSTLGQVLVDAWDGVKVLTLPTKTAPLRAKNAHISGCVHVTGKELRERLSSIDQSNGFANRYLWLFVSRVASIPRPQPFSLDHEVVAEIESAYQWALSGYVGGGTGELAMSWSDKAGGVWDEIYEGLRNPPVGLSRELLARRAPQAMRLAMIYALLDRSRRIEMPHLEAGLAWDRYSLASHHLIFDSETGNPEADRVLNYLRESGGVAPRTGIYAWCFGRRVQSVALDEARDVLVETNKIRVETPKGTGAGRPPERWVLLS